MDLIISGTGRVGGAVARALLAEGAPVRAGARDPDRLADLRALGLDIARVDMTRPMTLGPALKGVKRVVATAHAMNGKGGNGTRQVDLLGNRALIDAARHAGVERFVFISAQGVRADHPEEFYRYKFATEAHLRASGMPFTILRPSALMEFWGELIGGPVLTTGKATLYGPGNRPLSFISERDVVAFCLMALRGELGNTTLTLGAENHTHTQIAQLYARAAGRQLRLSHIPVPAMSVMATLIGPLNEETGRLIRAAAAMAVDDLTFDPTELLKAYPRRLVTFEEVAREAVAALRAA
jgi:uncharacterized protein YbjT (DUF2867 family)